MGQDQGRRRGGGAAEGRRGGLVVAAAGGRDRGGLPGGEFLALVLLVALEWNDNILVIIP